MCQCWQLEDLSSRLLRRIYGQDLQTSQELVYLIDRDSITPMSHEKPVTDLIEPKNRYQGTFISKSREDGQAVLAIDFIVKKPLERREKRPVPNRSQAVAFVDQFLNRDAL